MSHSCEETYDVYDERFPKARRPHECDACESVIRKGDRYAKVHIVFEGSAETVKRCLRCQRTHEHLRSLSPGEMWPDERLACGEDYEEEWSGPPPDAIARIPFLTDDEAQRELAPCK